MIATLTTAERSAIENVLAYMWQDEERDFNEQDEDGRNGHIFNDLKVLAGMVGLTSEVTT